MSNYYDTVVRFYDAEHQDMMDDLAMYSRLARSYGGPILDIGCGTGRVLLHLAREGYQVFGIDNNRAMLSRLQEKLENDPKLKELIQFDEANVLDHVLDRTFSLCLLTYNAMMHFHDQDDQLQVLRQIRSWTAETGLLVIDLPNAGQAFGTQDVDSLMVDRVFIDSETGHLVTLQSLSYIDRTTQMMRAEWFYDEVMADGTVKRTYVPHLLRYYFFAEIQLLLHQAGFEVEAVYGDTEGAPFEDGCDRMIIFANPA